MMIPTPREFFGWLCDRPTGLRRFYVMMLDETPVVGWVQMACEIERRIRKGAWEAMHVTCILVQKLEDA